MCRLLWVCRLLWGRSREIAPMLLKLTTLPGDGIGPEVVDQAVRVVEEVARAFGHQLSITRKPIGGAALVASKNPLPDDTLQACLSSSAVLLGAVGGLSTRLHDFYSRPLHRVSVRGYDHLVALDPPPSQAGEDLLTRAPCHERAGFAHLVWGPAEVEFALDVAAARLDLRAALAEVYRDSVARHGESS